MKRKQLIILLLAICPFGAFSQIQDTNLSKKEIRKTRPTYINLNAGINFSQFRDFATSPLFYSGAVKTFSLSRLKMDDNRESEVGLSYGFGNYNSTVNNTTSTSQLKRFAINYSQLYAIQSLSSEKWNVKVGGLFNTEDTMYQNAEKKKCTKLLFNNETLIKFLLDSTFFIKFISV